MARTCRVPCNTLHCASGLSRLAAGRSRRPSFITEEFVLLAIFQAAGWPIWLLLIASIVATALIVERLLSLRRSRILPPSLFDEVVRVYRSGNITSDIIAKLEGS